MSNELDKLKEFLLDEISQANKVIKEIEGWLYHPDRQVERREDPKHAPYYREQAYDAIRQYRWQEETYRKVLDRIEEVEEKEGTQLECLKAREKIFVTLSKCEISQEDYDTICEGVEELQKCFLK